MEIHFKGHSLRGVTARRGGTLLCVSLCKVICLCLSGKQQATPQVMERFCGEARLHPMPDAVPIRHHSRNVLVF